MLLLDPSQPDHQHIVGGSEEIGMDVVKHVGNHNGPSLNLLIAGRPVRFIPDHLDHTALAMVRLGKHVNLGTLAHLQDGAEVEEEGVVGLVLEQLARPLLCPNSRGNGDKDVFAANRGGDGHGLAPAILGVALRDAGATGADGGYGAGAGGGGGGKGAATGPIKFTVIRVIGGFLETRVILVIIVAGGVVVVVGIIISTAAGHVAIVTVTRAGTAPGFLGGEDGEEQFIRFEDVVGWSIWHGRKVEAVVVGGVGWSERIETAAVVATAAVNLRGWQDR